MKNFPLMPIRLKKVQIKKCTVGWPSRPNFTNPGMKDFTSKSDAVMLIVFLESIKLTMSQRENMLKGPKHEIFEIEFFYTNQACTDR
jgi:hypothetical protein